MPIQKLVAEDMLRLRVFRLPKRGHLRLGRWGVLVYPHKVTLVIGGRTPSGLAVERVWGTRGCQSRLICPSCGRKAGVLYAPASDRTPTLKCARCWRVTYKAWRVSGQTRVPKTEAAWHRWLDRRLRRVVGRGLLADLSGVVLSVDAVLKPLWEISQAAKDYDDFVHRCCEATIAWVRGLEDRARRGDAQAREVLRFLESLALAAQKRGS